MLFQPWKVAVGGVLVYLLVWFVAPVTPKFDLDAGAMTFIAMCYAAFLIGCAFVAYYRMESSATGDNISRRLQISYQPSFFWGSMVVGAAGAAIRYFDQVVNRGVDFSAGAVEARQALEHSSLGATGAVGVLLLPFCFLPLILLLCSGSLRGRLPHLLAAIMIFFVPAMLGLLILSRSTFMVTCILGYFTLCATRLDGRLLDPRVSLAGLLLLVLLLVGSTAILDQRIQDYGSTLTYSIANSVYAYCFNADQAAMSSVVTGEPFWSDFYSTTLPNSMYYLSGPYEFSLQWTRPDDQIHSYGLYFFDPYVKGLAALLQIDREALFQEKDLIFRPGSWGSFFTPLWVDFGWFSVLFMFLFGVAVTFISELVRNRSVNLLPLYLYLLVIIFFFPVINLMIAALGVFTVTTFIVFAIMTAGSTVDVEENMPDQVPSAA